MTEAKHTEDIIVKRIIDAPVEMVWDAWTKPEHIKMWWGPKDFTSPTCEVDLREGGKFLFCMHAPDYLGGEDSYSAGTYEKIVALERLEFTQSMADKDGNIIDPVSVGMPETFPKETRTVVSFKKIKDGTMTELTIVESGHTPDQMYIFALVGLYQSVDKMIESVEE